MLRVILVVTMLALVGTACAAAEAEVGAAQTSAATASDRSASVEPTTTLAAAAGATDETEAARQATAAALAGLEGCTISSKVELGLANPEVECLEAQLVGGGFLPHRAPGGLFDESVADAVRAFQVANGLVPDAVVGPLTATALGVWEEPPVPAPDPATCDDSGHSAVVDRDYQRAWLCADGEITRVMAMTSALTQPDPGVYEVYAKDLDAWSDLSGQPSTMTHFVAFTRGKYQGARIAFHSMPRYADGSFIQPLETLGSAEWHGDSAGCIRVLPDDAVLIWDWLEIGDTVTVVS